MLRQRVGKCRRHRQPLHRRLLSARLQSHALARRHLRTHGRREHFARAGIPDAIPIIATSAMVRDTAGHPATDQAVRGGFLYLLVVFSLHALRA